VNRYGIGPHLALEFASSVRESKGIQWGSNGQQRSEGSSKVIEENTVATNK
jgi:hypothetical protein